MQGLKFDLDRRILPPYSLSKFLGAFAKLQKETVRFAISVRASVYPHGTTRLPVDGFS
jgi:hypothetical protein